MEDLPDETSESTNASRTGARWRICDCGKRCKLRNSWTEMNPGRWVVVLGVSLVARLVPNFSDFLSLVGSSVCTVLGFVLPSLFHFMLHKEELGWGGLALDGAIVVLGLVLAVSGTWSSLLEIFAPKA